LSVCGVQTIKDSDKKAHVPRVIRGKERERENQIVVKGYVQGLFDSYVGELQSYLLVKAGNSLTI
jgi:hypothetical protein